jgi:hypothetical protein
MKRLPLLVTLLIPAGAALADDETATLLCSFRHGQLEIEINYTRETANGAPALISDQEIVWSPPEDKDSLAIINRYTGVMQISGKRKEYTGLCNKAR